MIKVNSQKDLEAELAKTKSAIALFYSSWCPYCLRFVPVFNEQITTSKFESVIHVVIDDNDNPLWDVYNISAVPTIIYFEEGKVCNRLDGRLGKGLGDEQFTAWLKKEFKQN